MIRSLQLLYPHFQLLNVLTHKLCTRLPLSIVVLAGICLLCSDALLACGLCTVAFLLQVYMSILKLAATVKSTHHLPLPASQTCFA